MSGKSIWDKYQLMVYVCLALFSVILGFVSSILSEGTMQSILVNLSSELFAVALLFCLFNSLIEKERARRANEKIFIVIKDDAREIKCPVPLLRSQFSRSEVYGVVGMIPMKEKGQRFTIKQITEFFTDVNRIAAGVGDDTIYIRCTNEEMEQFNFPESWMRQAV
jgi:hypothetical protein